MLALNHLTNNLYQNEDNSLVYSHELFLNPVVDYNTIACLFYLFPLKFAIPCSFETSCDPFHVFVQVDVKYLLQLQMMNCDEILKNKSLFHTHHNKARGHL